MPETATHINIDEQSVQRRKANYKPNIWNYDLLQSLKSEFSEEKFKRKIHDLKEELTGMVVRENDPLSKLELIDSIMKLGLANHFEKEIKEVLDTVSSAEKSSSNIEDNLYATALCFRLLRQYGYNASQDMFLGFFDEGGKFMTGKESNIRDLIELFEASNMVSDGENLLDEAKIFTMESLRSYGANSDHRLSKQVVHALSLPLHWRVGWYDMKQQICEHERGYNMDSKLIELAKINFNIVQAAQQQDLEEITRWWMNLGIKEKLSFSRDRIVESFMYAGGLAFEPQYGSLRKCLSKVIQLILVIDDVYDIYGSLNELECFTNAVVRWKPEEVKGLPECMKICFWALYNTTDEIAVEMQKKGWSSVLPYLQKGWADFCKSLLLEAKWDNKGYTSSLQEYLDNGWISSSCPLLSLHVIFSVANHTAKDISRYLEDNRDIIYYTSLITRLCNDQGTSAAELERGDAPSSILCYMRETSITEEAAREHIRSLIRRTWRKINTDCVNNTSFLQEPVKCIINIARVAHFIYQHGDGFGVQDRETKQEVLSNLIEPLPLY